MATTVISSVIASDTITNLAVAGCFVFAVIMMLRDEKRRPIFTLLSRHVTIFMIPLTSLFTYIAIVWLARILVG